MGYAKSGQDTTGIHIRLFARSFILVDEKGTRICMVNTDLAMVSQIVKLEVLYSCLSHFSFVSMIQFIATRTKSRGSYVCCLSWPGNCLTLRLEYTSGLL